MRRQSLHSNNPNKHVARRILCNDNRKGESEQVADWHDKCTDLPGEEPAAADIQQTTKYPWGRRGK